MVQINVSGPFKYHQYPLLKLSWSHSNGTPLRTGLNLVSVLGGFFPYLFLPFLLLPLLLWWLVQWQVIHVIAILALFCCGSCILGHSAPELGNTFIVVQGSLMKMLPGLYPACEVMPWSNLRPYVCLESVIHWAILSPPLNSFQLVNEWCFNTIKCVYEVTWFLNLNFFCDATPLSSLDLQQVESILSRRWETASFMQSQNN